MSRRLAPALALVALAAACSGEADSTSTSSVPATQQTSTSTTLPVAQTTTTLRSTTTMAPEQEATSEIEVKNGVVKGGGLIDVALGDEVRIVVTSDAVDEAHLHGYDIAAEVGPGIVGVLEFTADIPGVFDLELEDSGVELGRVQVSP